MKLYTVYITPNAQREIKNLPGNVRQRVKRLVKDLAENPYSGESKVLDVSGFERKLLRLRLGKWRVV